MTTTMITQSHTTLRGKPQSPSESGKAQARDHSIEGYWYRNKALANFRRIGPLYSPKYKGRDRQAPPTSADRK